MWGTRPAGAAAGRGGADHPVLLRDWVRRDGLAQIPHVLLAAHAPTIMGVESNAMQFYPDASAPEAAVHPGLYRRSEGRLDLSTVTGPGIGWTRSIAACPRRRRTTQGMPASRDASAGWQSAPPAD